MDKDTQLAIIDIGICVLVLYYFASQRFNQWPRPFKNQLLFSGKPSDYIDPFRYHAFFMIYILTFFVAGFIIHNLGIPIPKDSGIYKVMFPVVDRIGLQSWTAVAVTLMTLINENHVAKLDLKWRNRLQSWARIPKAVMEMKEHLIISEKAVEPAENSLENLKTKMKQLGVDGYWGPVIDDWRREREKASLNWSFLKTLYVQRLCKQLRVAAFYPEDMDRYEKRAHDLARVLPKVDYADEDTRNYRDEINELYAGLIEGLCKHIVRKNPSKKAQRGALHNMGFRPCFYDVPEIKISLVSLNCLFCAAIVCVGCIFVYLKALDLPGFEIPAPGGDETWFTEGRLMQWSLGSVVSYAMAIFIAILIDTLATHEQRLAGMMTYVSTLVLSTIGALVFFRISVPKPDQPLNLSAFMFLSLSMGVISLAVMRSLKKETSTSQKASLISALYHGLLIGSAAGPFQALAVHSFIASAPAKAVTPFNVLAVSAVYGFAKGALVTFVVSFLIQDSIRKQLNLAQRKSPRVKFKTRLPVSMENEENYVTTRNISRGGICIEPGKQVAPGQTMMVRFPFGALQARVQWASKKFAGLSIIDQGPKLEDFYAFIRNRFGYVYV